MCDIAEENNALSEAMLALATPRASSKIKYPSWTAPYLESTAEFYCQNAELFNSLDTNDYRTLLSIYARNYSWSNSPSMTLSAFMFRTTLSGCLFTPKSLDYLDCYREPSTGNTFTVFDKNTHEEIMSYVYMKVKGPDRKAFLKFVMHRLSEKVAGTGYEELIMEPCMDKYKHLYIDEMLKGQGLGTLYEQRDYRDQILSTEKYLKLAMTTTSSLPCTIDKYNYPNPYMDLHPNALVLVYGSGNTKCSLRFLWRNTFCIDPVWAGPPGTGFRGTHDQFHAALEKGDIKLPLNGHRLPGFIVNDACGFVDQTRKLMEGPFGQHELRGRTRAMCPDQTNKISSDILEFWIPRGYSSHEDDGRWFAMKSGVAYSYPTIFSEMVASDFRKTRPTNAEVTVLLKGEFHLLEDDPTEPLPAGETSISWARCCNRQNLAMYVGNNHRMYHDMTRSFPERGYGYPAGFSRCMENARANVYLTVPRISGVSDKNEVKRNKRALRELDFDDVEHDVDPSTIARSTLGKDVEGEQCLDGESAVE